MIKKYSFDYNSGDASAEFSVDTSVFTPDLAYTTLDYFTWDEPYDKAEDPIDEVMKKYALKAITIATFNNYNTNGVIREFGQTEGFGSVDGSIGIQLIDVCGYQFSECYLEIKVKP